MIAKLVVFWGAVGVVPAAYIFVIQPTGIVRSGSLVIFLGLLVLGFFNVLLYVIARAISLGQSDRI